MNVWCHLPTIFKRRQALRTAGLITLCVAITTTLFFIMPARAATGVNQTLSFQGRLQSPSGAIVPDGYYNIQFKLYQDGDGTAAGNTEGSPAGSLKWTENHVNNNANQGIRVKNGYFSVTLGSVTPFGSSVDWNQDTLWLSMNIAGTAANCTDFTSCSPDGEMLPMKRLTAVPYAIQAQNATTLNGLESTDLIHNQNTAQQTSSNFWISGTGRADTALQAPAIDTASVGTLTIGGTHATNINLAQDVTVAAGKTITMVGGATNTRPVSPSEGMVYYDTTTHQLLTYNGNKWVADKADSVIVAASNSSQSDKDAANYVADGTGDQVEINAALTAAVGKKVVLLAGTYSANATITIPNNTTLTGVGAGSLVQLADIDATDNLIENSDTSTGTGVTIQDLKIDGQDTLNTAGTQSGIYFNNMGDYTASRSGSVIRNVQISNFRSQGIFYNSSDNNTISGSTISGMDAGGATLGIYLESSSRNNNITDNVFTGNSYSIRADGSGTTNNSIAQNVFRSNSYGIMLYSATNTSITGNNFDASTNYSVSIYNDSGANGYNNVTSNSFRGDGVSIAIENMSDNTVNNNKINDSGTNLNNNAIRLIGNADRNTVSSNSITDSSCTTTCYAITITASTGDVNMLSDNSLGSNGTISDSGTGTIYANQLDANGKLINKSAAGSSVQTSTNSTTAFQVQNAAGTSALTVNTTTNSVLVAGSLDTTTTAAMTIGSTNASSITIGKSSSNIATTVLGTAIFKPTTGNDSTTAFQVQNASSTALLTADTTNMQVVIGNGSDTITLSSSGISFAGNARGTKQIRLAAEYQNTVLDSGTGSNNSGTMVSTLDLTNRMNFYRWSATPATAQTYDIVTQVPIPQDFSAWAASNPLSITSRTNHTTDGVITLELRDSSGTERCSFTSLTMGSANSWITNTPSCLSSGTYTPGDYLTMRLRMSSKNNAQVDVGNIVLNYLSNK